jgi:hypothetical protein
MFLTSIIVGASYFFLSTIFHQFKWYKETSALTEEFAATIYQINRSLFEADRLHFENRTVFILQDRDTIALQQKIFTRIDLKLIQIDTLFLNQKELLRIEIQMNDGFNKESVPFLLELYR